MATNKRTYPNSNFAWYNDEDRLAIVCEDTTATSGERTKEKYDSFQGAGNLSGTITTFANNGDGTVRVTDTAHGLITGDRITISSSPDSYYNTASSNSDGNYSITLVSDDTFDITVTYEAEDSGTWTSLFIDNGLRITFHAKYEEATLTTNNLQSDLGLDSALHNAVLCYVKSRLYEDDEDLEYSQYFRQMYEQKIKKFRGRRSAVRHLAVTRL